MRTRLRPIFVPTALALVLVGGCARHPVTGARFEPRPSPPTVDVAAVPTAALLPLDRILPPAVLPAPATRPSTNPAAPARPPLEALTLYAEACDNLLKHRRLAAVGLLEKAAALDPDSYELQFALGRAYLGAGGSDDRSIAALGRAAEIDPDHVELQADLGRQYLARGDADRALWHLRLALNTTDYATNEAEAAVAELFAGRALARAGYHAAALDVYERLMRRLDAPSFSLRGDPEVAYLLARPDLLRLQAAESYEKVGRYREALAAYDASAERDPDELAPRARGVRVLLAMGRFDDATARAAGAVARSGGDPAAVALLREACRAAGREGAAVDELRRLRRQRPGDASLLAALADVLRGEGRAGEAFDLLTSADTSPPSAAAVRRTYACAVDADHTGRKAGRFLIDWSSRHPDAVHLLSPLWDDLLRPSRSYRLDLRSMQRLEFEPAAPRTGGRPAKPADVARWEAAKWFWVARVAGSRHRQDIARAALRRSVTGPAVFAPAYRAASGAAGIELSPATSAGGATRPAVADTLVGRAAEAGEPALAAELRGLALLGKKQFVAARKALDEAASLGGASPDLAFARAIAARGAGESGEFERLLRQTIAGWPAYPNAYEALYGYYSDAGDDAAAGKVLSAWLSADASSVTAGLIQARDSIRGGRVAAGERQLEALLAERGDDARVLAAARSYYASAARTDAFVARLRERHDADPASVTVAAQLVDLLDGQRRLADASRVLDATREAVATDPDLLYDVAHLYERVGQKPMAEQVLRDVLKLDPAHAAAANDLGYSLAEEGRDLDEADALTRRAAEADPSNPSFLDSMGWVQYKRGRFDAARDALDRSVELSRAQGSDADPVVLDHLGDVTYRACDHEGAGAWWKQAIDRLAAPNAAAGRDDLKSLRLQLERKAKQVEAGQPAGVAPVAADTGVPARATRAAPPAAGD